MFFQLCLGYSKKCNLLFTGSVNNDVISENFVILSPQIPWTFKWPIFLHLLSNLIEQTFLLSLLDGLDLLETVSLFPETEEHA